jgi:orotidine-5'-phosphate decarboxylase
VAAAICYAQAVPAADRLCFALDVDTQDAALALVDELKDVVGCFKIGLELFIATGPQLVRAVRARGVDVFLDLKLHDISATVAAAVKSAVALDVRYLTVHASGGPGMLAAAAAAAGTRTTILAVTALTSLSDGDLRAVGFVEPASSLVLRLARLAEASGVPGIVCSPREVELVRQAAPALITVTPGIRGASDDNGDQVRTMSAGDAIAAGAHVLVVGRPIRLAPDRRAAASAIAADIDAAALIMPITTSRRDRRAHV